MKNKTIIITGASSGLGKAMASYYLSSSDFITGETINVAGGHSIGHSI